MSVFQRVHMPSLGGVSEWIDSEPLDPAGLRGQVVLVNFWTWTCINWLRQEPYVRAWSQAYRDDGLIVIGVHTPEFSFEHDIEGVRRAVKERDIDYPVAVDNEYEVWSAFANNYWPALYFVDREGIIRDQHFGEGRYEESERRIQRLLGVEREPVSVEGVGVEAEADWDHLQTPETYLGDARGERSGSPDRLRLNHWAITGEWSTGPESLVLEEAGGSIAFRFHARDAHLVMSPGTREAPHTAWTSTRRETGRSGRAACTSSCASTTRSASAPSRSRSSTRALRPTRSRSGRRRCTTTTLLRSSPLDPGGLKGKSG
jgi:thiol-disulfide isomerase/thioredoxin